MEVSETGAQIVAIASGKGGVGKSLLTANLGIFLATLGKRVAVCDLALGNANLHIFVGVERPRRTLADMMDAKSFKLGECLVETPVAHLSLLSGARDPAWAANPKSSQLTRLRAQVTKLDVDYVILDLGAGSAGTNLDFALLADKVIVMLTPEPPATELAYRFIRSLFIRRLRKASLGNAGGLEPDELREYEGGVPSAIDILRRVIATETPEQVAKIEAAMTQVAPLIVLNEVRSKSDSLLGPAMADAARRRMGLPIGYLGHLDHDDAVWVTLRRRRPLLVEHPESRIAKCVERIARGLLASDADAPSIFEPLVGDTYYQLLGVVATASDEEIRRANRRARDVFSRESIVVSGLYTSSRLDELHRLIEDAHSTLMDPRRRKEYDLKLFPDGLPNRHVPTVPPPIVSEALAEKDRPEMPTLDPETEFTGPLMQQIREARGLDLREISEKTKIGMTYLSSIEGEIWEKLPAMVYVRGFLVEYARMLRLDVERVLATYLPRFRDGAEANPS